MNYYAQDLINGAFDVKHFLTRECTPSATALFLIVFLCTCLHCCLRVISTWAHASVGSQRNCLPSRCGKKSHALMLHNGSRKRFHSTSHL